jgi:hypothetical protein
MAVFYLGLHGVVWQKFTDVSEMFTASIITYFTLKITNAMFVEICITSTFNAVHPRKPKFNTSGEIQGG